MRIDGTGNFIAPHIARAYGVSQQRAIAPAAASSPIAAIGPVSGASPATGLQSLVAARVSGPVQFDGVSVPRPAASALSLYTRAADKIEAATAVHIGRTIDLKG